MRSVFLAATFIVLAAVFSHAPAQEVIKNPLAGVEEIFDRLSREMMCLCGCNATIKNCPHVDCDFAIPARKQIRLQLEQGKSHDDVMSWFVAKFGEVVLASPKKEGFNLVGYILPFMAIIAVGWIVMLIIKKWAGENATVPVVVGKAAAKPVGANDDAVARMRKELSEFED